MMKKNKYSENIDGLAAKFKKRAKKGSDKKRHDRIRLDEAEAMRFCHDKLGASEVEISNKFNRDVRQVHRHIKKLKARLDLEPVRLTAISEHLQEIRQLLESWREKIEMAIDFFPTRVGFDYTAEDETLFLGLMEHCPSIAEKYKVFDEQRNQYKQAEIELAIQITRQVPAEVNELFSKTIVYYALFAKMDGPSPQYEVECKNGWLRIDEFGEKRGIAKGNEEILYRCKQKHSELIEHYSDSQEVLQMVKIQEALCDLEKTLVRCIDVSLLSKEYTKYGCRYCRNI